MKRILNSMFLITTTCVVSMVFAQSEPSATWQPDFNEDRLLSMPDLLPLLGNFGAQWEGSSEGQGQVSPVVVEVDWTGRENEALKLPYHADIVILNPGVNDLSDPDQRTVSIRQVLVESYLVNSGVEADATEIHSAMPMKQQVLFMSQGKDVHGEVLPHGTRFILHMPDGSKGEVSTNSMGSISVSGKPLRTMASLFHAGGQVYFTQ
jgi:hypothetical protein